MMQGGKRSHYYTNGEAWLYTAAGRLVQRLEQKMPPVTAIRATVHEMVPPADQLDAILHLYVQIPSMASPHLIDLLRQHMKKYLTDYLREQITQQPPMEEP